MRKGTVGRLALVVAAAGALAVPAGALGATPRTVQQGYGAVGAASAGFQAVAAGPENGSLPFTGLDLGLIAAGGGGLMLLGGALKRAGQGE